MAIAFLADIHGNIEALDAVLRDLDARAPGALVVVAGDVVGYGPDPAACIARLREREALCVKGNHEEMVLGERDTRGCVAAGILAVAWTRRVLAQREREHLRDLPSLLALDDAGLVVCHGDLDDAGTYVSDAARAGRTLAQLQQRHPHARLLVCGHTHIPMQHASAAARLINPGAVGQARDGVIQARYALLRDDDAAGAITFHQVPYDHRATLAKLRAARLIPRVALTPPRGRVRRQVERGKAALARAYVKMQEETSPWR